MLNRALILMLIPFQCLFANDGFTTAIRDLIGNLIDGSDDEEEVYVTETEHSITLSNGTLLSYTALTGVLPQFYQEKKVGEIFFTAYVKETEDANRPVTFIFGGGPGGSSISMHIGGIGPRRLLLPEEGQKSLPPYKMIDNAETLLRESDLVFIDPMGTGYSRADKEWYKNLCYGVEGDLNSFVEFIRVFCIHYNKWNSPKYLMGSSYGTARSCGLAERLAWEGIHLNGIMMLGCVLDFSTIYGDRDQALSDCLLIPTLAATAWYYDRTMGDKTLEEVVEYGRRFIAEESAPILFQPSRLDAFQQKEYFQGLADLIGLPLDTVRRYAGRINECIYTREFLAAERKVIGGLDSRFAGDVSSINGFPPEDPSYRNFRPAIYPAYMNYLQKDLDLQMKSLTYHKFSNEAFDFWDWRTYDAFGLPNFLQRLRRTLIANPSMKVFIGSGYYDLRTPFSAAEYSMSHLDLPGSYRDNFQLEYYEAGHAFIFDSPSLSKFTKDVRKFYGVQTTSEEEDFLATFEPFEDDD